LISRSFLLPKIWLSNCVTMILSFETNSEALNNSQRSIQYPFLESYNKQQLRSSLHFTLNLSLHRQPSSGLRPVPEPRLDRPSEIPVAFVLYDRGLPADEPACHQIPVNRRSPLCPFRWWIGTGTVGRTCRAPCPSSSCHSWHRALLMDVCSRNCTR